MPVIYSARWVLPISSPPIPNGAVAIHNSAILAVGPRTKLLSDFPGAPSNEFGEAAILPGLVNAHSHLELTVMRGLLEKEESDFFAWLRKLTFARMAMTTDDLIASATLGAIEAARAGITCLGDSSSLAMQPMRALCEVGLRGIVYQESFGPDPKLAAENLGQLRDQLGEMRALETGKVRSGVSPHAPYTVSASQLEMISKLALDDQVPLMIHAAESKAEQAFMTRGAGPFADGLRQRGIEWRAPGVSTIKYLRDLGILDTSPLLAHCITVDENDLDIVRDAGAGVAHCPKSNAKLRHGRAPFENFIRGGLKVGLGSDSVASNNSCDILEEARFATLMARTAGADVSAEQALFAATLGGARALGLGDQIGALQTGMQADLTVVSLNGSHQQPLTDPVDTLVFSSSGRDVVLTIVAGKELYRHGQVATVDESDCIKRGQEIRARLATST